MEAEVQLAFRPPGKANRAPDTKEKPFACLCGRSFTRNDLLKRHRARDHDEAAATLRDTVNPVSSRPYSVLHDASTGAEPVAPCPSSLQDTNTSHQAVVPAQNVSGPNDQETPFDAYCFPDVFDEFTTFIQSAGLDPSWEDQDLHLFDPELIVDESTNKNVSRHPDPVVEEAMEDADGFAEISPCRAGDVTSGHSQTAFLWQISDRERQTFGSKIDSADPDNSPFRLPSRHALTRYLQSYADTFHKHFPMIHLPSYSIEQSPPELSLALTAVGAQYRFEYSNGLRLYSKARAITWERIRGCQNLASTTSNSEPSLHAECGNPSSICTMVLLMAFASWMQGTDLLSQASEFQAPLAHALYQDGFIEPDSVGKENDWKSWISAEYRRRAKLIGFAFLNMHTVIYNTPILVFANDIHLLQPCSSAEWAAATSDEWLRTRAQRPSTKSFQQCFRHLLLDQRTAENAESGPDTTPLSLYVLLQGILQKIQLAHQLRAPGSACLQSSGFEFLG